MLDNWSSGNMVSSWGSNMVGSWGSNMVGSWGSNMVGSWDNSRGSLNLNSLDRSNSWGSNSKRGSNSMVVGNWRCNSWSRGIDTSYQAMAISKVLSISISSRSSIAAGSKREDNKALHIVWCW